MLRYFVFPTPCDVWENPCIPGEGLRLPEQPVVVGMPADPEPKEIALVFHGHGAVMDADTDRPEASDLLEMQRWMAGILAQHGIAAVGQTLHIVWQLMIVGPKA